MSSSAKQSRSKPGSPKSRGTSGGSESGRKSQHHNDEMTRTIETLRNENDELKRKLKIICKKVVDNVDMSEYSFIDAERVEPDEIDVNDLLHMIQKLALMATQVRPA